MSEARAEESVALACESFEPPEEGLREALTSSANGYSCTRGTAEWQDCDSVHYPGTYAHGGYNRETTVLGGHSVLTSPNPTGTERESGSVTLTFPAGTSGGRYASARPPGRRPSLSRAVAR